jgi:hypothetical protein
VKVTIEVSQRGGCQLPRKGAQAGVWELVSMPTSCLPYAYLISITVVSTAAKLL